MAETATAPDATYEGWANRETWCVTLWIRNEEPTYDAACRMAPELVELVERDGLNNAADRVRDWVEGLVFGDYAPANLATDLVMGALARVDWREVTTAIIEDGTGS